MRYERGQQQADDLKDVEHLAAYQRHMRQLFSLDKFAFVDTDGLIYTSRGMQYNIEEYAFAYKTLSEPNISLFSPDGVRKQVIVAVPVSLSFGGKTLCVCFMAIDMGEMLAGVSMETSTNEATFCNIYTADGWALTDIVRRSMMQSLLTLVVMALMFGLVIEQIRRNNRIVLEHRTADAENRVKQENLEQRLALQEQLLAEQRQRQEQDSSRSAPRRSICWA